MSKVNAKSSTPSQESAETITAFAVRNGRILATQQQIATLLGKTPRTLRYWASYMPRRPDGRYDLAKVIDWYAHQHFNEDGTVHLTGDYDPDA